MSDHDESSKTEEPTAKRLREAWDAGDFARAPEVTAAAILMAAFAVFAYLAPGRATEIMEMSRRIFANLSRITLTQETTVYWLQVFIGKGVLFLAPLLAAVVIGVVVGGGLQTNFHLSTKALESKLDRLDPAKGFQKLFSPQKLTQFLVDLIKFVAMGVILYVVIDGILADPIFHASVSPLHIAQFFYGTMMQILLYLVVAVTLIGTAHLVYQKRKKMGELRMTRQEVKDEMKTQEGNPQVKSARRQMALRLLQKRMLKAVPMADVVVTNPTHYAVALRYDKNKDMAPVVLAKGERRFALRIKRVAQEHGVPMVENRLAARLLYKLGKVGAPIPGELYQVIAEILSFVYKTHRLYFHERRRREMRGEAVSDE